MPEDHENTSSDEEQEVSDVEMNEEVADVEMEDSNEEVTDSEDDDEQKKEANDDEEQEEEANDNDEQEEEELEELDDEEQEEEEANDDEDTKPDTESVVHRNIYVQFPRKRPENAETELLKVSDKIKYIRFPRQKKARFCYVHCETEADAIDVEKVLRTTEVCGFKVFVNRKRKIDDPAFRQKLKEKQIEKKIAKRDAKRLKEALKRKGKSGKKAKSNKIVVSGIPEDVTATKLKEIFSTSVEFQYREKPNKVAFVTFSTPEEATKFIKNHPKVGERELAIRPMLVVKRKKKQFKGKKEKKAEEEVVEEKIEVEKVPKTKKKAKELPKVEKKGKEMPKSKSKDKFVKKQKSPKATKTPKGKKINYVSLKKTLE
ncbi:DNA ligase 1-like [Culicoides brevitarsis]|uniref:DNA ligase 1-like n=1 Tax=Culicoides brevitarsis TaxID=469753 RepID=UPI00307C8933